MRPQDIVQLATMLPECQFMMCGDGPMMNFLQQEIDSKNFAQCVHIINRIDNAMEFYSEIDALAIPSEIEGLPLVLLEAMASRAHPAHHIPWPNRVFIRTGRYSSASRACSHANPTAYRT